MLVRSIAIDGPAGAGKSTLARTLAKQLGFLYVDTGAIYRTLGLMAARHSVDCADVSAVVALLQNAEIHMTHDETDGLQHMFLCGDDVTSEIRQNEISRYASAVSSIPEVRAFLLDMQRNLAKTQNVVMDGRDIGTVVLPQADLKIFLTATPETRAERRYRELQEKGEDVLFQTVLDEMLHRDEADQNRLIAPLKRAEDAILLDTSHLTLEESLSALRNLAKEKLGL